MFSKRRIILFLLVLAVMLLVKYAASQEIVQGQIGWDYLSDGNSSECDVYGFVFGVLAVGSLMGLMRAWIGHYSFNHGWDFEPEMIRLRLS